MTLPYRLDEAGRSSGAAAARSRAGGVIGETGESEALAA